MRGYLSYISSQIDGLGQERRNSIANALELRLPCTNPSKYTIYLAVIVELYMSGILYKKGPRDIESTLHI